MVEPRGRQLARVGERGGGEREVTAEAGVVGHVPRVGPVPAGPQRPGRLPVQQRGPAGSGRRAQRLADQLVPEPEAMPVLDEQAPAYPFLEVVQQRGGRAGEDRGDEVEVHLRAEHRGSPQGRRRRAGTLAPFDDGVADRLGQVAAGGVHELDQEQRVAGAARVQVGGALAPGHLPDRGEVQRAELDDVGRGWRAALTGSVRDDDQQRQVVQPVLDVPEPTERAAVQPVPVVDQQDDHPGRRQPGDHRVHRRVQQPRAGGPGVGEERQHPVHSGVVRVCRTDQWTEQAGVALQQLGLPLLRLPA